MMKDEKRKKILTSDSTICQGFMRSGADQKPMASENVFDGVTC